AILTCTVAWEPDTCQDVQLTSQTKEKSRLYFRDGKGEPALVKNVTLTEQISQTPCVKWYNFGHSGFSVMAENGCHGKFSVCYTSGHRLPEVPIHRTIACTNLRLTSRERVPDQRFISQYVSGGDYIVSMELLHQMTAVSCVLGLSFIFYDHRVEARFGCKGDFRVCVDTLIVLNNNVPDVQCQRYILMSRSGLEERFTVPLSYGGIVSMVVINEYSKNMCVHGKNYGFNKNHGLEIYARDGCQAEFDVCQSPQDLNPPRSLWAVI
ncbi:unnamed protein product, partial [Candidula unifasciata]